MTREDQVVAIALRVFGHCGDRGRPRARKLLMRLYRPFVGRYMREQFVENMLDVYYGAQR